MPSINIPIYIKSSIYIINNYKLIDSNSDFIEIVGS